MITISKLVANSIVITTGGGVKPETHIKFVNGTEGDYLLEENVDYQQLIEKGLMQQAGGPPTWIKQPQEVDFGSAVTSIGLYAFMGCISLTSVMVPASVTSIADYVFSGENDHVSVTFSGKDKATVQGMTNYSWNLPSGCVIHCTDGDITLK